VSLSAWIGLTIGLSACVQVGLRTHKRLRRTRASRVQRGNVLDRASKLVRDLAKETLELKRDARRMTEEMERMETRTQDRTKRISELEASAVRIYVLDDRKTPNDNAFVVTVSHPSFERLAPGAPPELARSWAGGRRYLVWAVDRDKANVRAALRCPAGKGYVIAGPAEPMGAAALPQSLQAVKTRPELGSRAPG
jgi:hypothetical protein